MKLVIVATGLVVLTSGCTQDGKPTVVEPVEGDIEVLTHRLSAAERRIRALEAEVYDGFKNNKEFVCDGLLKGLGMAIGEYWHENQEYPPSGNASLVSALKKTNREKVPYFQFKQEMLNPRGELMDPWGTPLVYRNSSEWKRLKSAYVLYSCGKNGEDEGGMGDDISAR